MSMEHPNAEHDKALDSVPIPILRSKRARGEFPTSDDRWALV